MKLSWGNIRLALRKLNHWLWFVLLLSLIPLANNVWKLCGINEKTIIENIGVAVSHGELLLICMSILAASIGEIMSKETDYRSLKSCFVGFCLIMALFAMNSYSEISLQEQFKKNIPLLNIDYIFHTSSYILFFTVLLSVACLLLPDKEKNYVIGR